MLGSSFFSGCVMTATHVTSDVFGDRELPADQGFDLLNWVRVWVDLGKSGTAGESAEIPVPKRPKRGYVCPWVP